jgi:hypothetical protein
LVVTAAGAVKSIAAAGLEEQRVDLATKAFISLSPVVRSTASSSALNTKTQTARCEGQVLAGKEGVMDEM